MKPINIKQTAAVVLLAVCFLYHDVQAQSKAGVFYAITGKNLKDTSWLFGTYHLINDSYLKEIPRVSHAFTNAQTTVVEVILDSAELAVANGKALLQNKQLSQLLDKGFVDSLDVLLKENIGQGIEQFQPLKPMMVMLSFSMFNLMKDNGAILGKYTGLPLDAYFVAASKSAGKKTIALETLREQMDFLFNHLSDEEQAAMLQTFIRNKEEGLKMGNDLLKAYFENDIEKIYDSYEASVKISGDMRFLVTDRNNNWMKVLPSIISKQSVFIAVGALHLAGPHGIVKQLQNEGYTVTAQNMTW